MPRPSPARHYPWWINLLLASLVLLLGAALLALIARPATAGLLPVAARSNLLADYSADPHNTPFAAVDLRLVAEVWRDQQQRTPAQTAGAPTPTLLPVQALLATPVMAVTLAPGQPTPTPWPTATAAPTETREPTASPAPPSATVAASPTEPAFSTPTATPSERPTLSIPTRVPTRNIWPTATYVIPATTLPPATATWAPPTDTPAPPPSDTEAPVLPTEPPPATDPATDAPPPTDTPAPPPATEAPDPYEPPPATEPPPGYP